MRRYVFLLIILSVVGCRRDVTPTSQNEIVADSIPDSLVADSDIIAEPAPPAAADGNFDDFVFNWMRNKNFQLERTAFPLPVIEEGRTYILTGKDWKHEPLFSKKDVYTMIFDNERSMKNVADTAVKCVTVEMIKLRDQSVTAYVFVKHLGAWRMVGIRKGKLSDNKNSDFLNFYRRFASDENFQRKHVASSFELSVIDPDSYEHLRGTADAGQWMFYAPEFPSNIITNVNYGQKYADTGERVFVVSSPDGMMSSTITFKKRGSRWFAVKLDNN